MSKYTDHEHKWQIEYNFGGLLLVKCAECKLCVDLFGHHLTLTDYTVKDKNKLSLRVVTKYESLIK